MVFNLEDEGILLSLLYYLSNHYIPDLSTVISIANTYSFIIIISYGNCTSRDARKSVQPI